MEPLGHMLEAPNYPQTKAAAVGAILYIWREGGGRHVGCAAARGETPQIGKPGPSAKLAGLVPPSVTGCYVSSTIERTLLISISYEGMGWRVVHAEGRGIAYSKRTLLGNLGLQHHKKWN